jgi:hypothetical protein
MKTEIETISWRQLTGNKFVKGIEPAMLSENGFVKRTAIRRIGDQERTFFDVVYDREYLLEAISRYICKEMLPVGKKATLKLIAEAWDRYYPELPDSAIGSEVTADGCYPQI